MFMHLHNSSLRAVVVAACLGLLPSTKATADGAGDGSACIRVADVEKTLVVDAGTILITTQRNGGHKRLEFAREVAGLSNDVPYNFITNEGAAVQHAVRLCVQDRVQVLGRKGGTELIDKIVTVSDTEAGVLRMRARMTAANSLGRDRLLALFEGRYNLSADVLAALGPIGAPCEDRRMKQPQRENCWVMMAAARNDVERDQVRRAVRAYLRAQSLARSPLTGNPNVPGPVYQPQPMNPPPGFPVGH